MILSNVLRYPRSLVRKLGYDVVRYSNALTVANARRLYALAENEIDVVLDVGASEGNYATKLRESGYSGRIISFEPLGESYDRLLAASSGDDAWQAVKTAIADHDGTETINVSGRSTSSSLLRMAPSHLAAAPDSAYVSQEQVPVKRLDTVLTSLVRPEDNLYLKIDVQGYEASVLAGAVETLKATRAVEVEVSMVSLYEGSILYAQMIQIFDTIGFHLISWEDVLTDPRTGYVLQSDCIFTRRT
jgi:FkbM family methyltransferase